MLISSPVKEISVGIARSMFLVLSRFPLCILRTLGSFLGVLAWTCSSGYKRKLLRNIRLAYPDYSACLPFRAYVQMFQNYAELPFIWSHVNKESLRKIHASLDWSPVRASLDSGEGVMVLSVHVGAYELLLPLFALDNKISVLYKPSKTLWIQKLIESTRVAPNLEMITASRDGVKALLRDLHEGKSIGMLVDHVPPSGSGVFAPFYGRAAYTTTLPQRLQLATRCKIFVVGLEREGLSGYKLHILSQEAPLSSNRELAATEINALVEQLINRMPSQYLWGYNRYKPPIKKLK